MATGPTLPWKLNKNSHRSGQTASQSERYILCARVHVSSGVTGRERDPRRQRGGCRGWGGGGVIKIVHLWLTTIVDYRMCVMFTAISLLQGRRRRVSADYYWLPNHPDFIKRSVPWSRFCSGKLNCHALSRAVMF